MTCYNFTVMFAKMHFLFYIPNMISSCSVDIYKSITIVNIIRNDAVYNDLYPPHKPILFAYMYDNMNMIMYFISK